MHRSLFLRVRGRPLREFFAFIEAPQQRGSSSQSSTRPNPSGGRRRVLTRAADVDSEGRREGGRDADDAEGNLTEKDLLPAYEVKGGPPNYSQFLAVDLGTSTNARLQITEAMPVGTSQSQLVETSSGTSDLPAQTRPVLGIPLPHLPPPSYSPATVTNHPIRCYSPTGR